MVGVSLALGGNVQFEYLGFTYLNGIVNFAGGINRGI